ncbi:MAG: hypothetical protein IT435_04965 [Phycisphaerales bacterium]|nr:hypothetical protein [Phycisphaerales bacterium]
MSRSLRKAQVRAWGVWTVTSGLAGVLAVVGFRPETIEEGLMELGLIFAAYVMSMGVIARHAKDASTLLVMIWGGMFGMWCHSWHGLCDKAVDQFLPKLGVGPQVVESMDLPAAIAGAGMVSAALLLVATKSTRVAWSTVAASLGGAVVPLIADDPSTALPWVAFGWHAVVAAAMAFWAVDEAMRGSGARCQACGSDVQGLSSPVCPHCSAPLGAHVRDIFAPLPDRRPV